jgi:heat shock protein HslJ
MTGGAIEGIEWRGADDTSLHFEDGRVSGSAGINRLMGDYTLTDDLLAFGVIATTRMAGPPERMEAEQRFLAALARVGRWSTVDHEPETACSLVLADGDGVELLRLVAEPAA